MKKRFQKCMESYPVSDWSASIHIRKNLIESEIENLPFLSSSALKWDPVACSSANFCVAYRSRGRPLTRWDDYNTHVPSVPSVP